MPVWSHCNGRIIPQICLPGQFNLFLDWFTKCNRINVFPKYVADVAELADAQASGACGLTLVEVRLLSSALQPKLILLNEQKYNTTTCTSKKYGSCHNGLGRFDFGK